MKTRRGSRLVETWQDEFGPGATLAADVAAIEDEAYRMGLFDAEAALRGAVPEAGGREGLRAPAQAYIDHLDGRHDNAQPYCDAQQHRAGLRAALGDTQEPRSDHWRHGSTWWVLCPQEHDATGQHAAASPAAPETPGSLRYAAKVAEETWVRSGEILAGAAPETPRCPIDPTTTHPECGHTATDHSIYRRHVVPAGAAPETREPHDDPSHDVLACPDCQWVREHPGQDRAFR